MERRLRGWSRYFVYCLLGQWLNFVHVERFRITLLHIRRDVKDPWDQATDDLLWLSLSVAA